MCCSSRGLSLQGLTYLCHSEAFYETVGRASLDEEVGIVIVRGVVLSARSVSSRRGGRRSTREKGPGGRDNGEGHHHKICSMLPDRRRCAEQKTLP